MPCREMLSYLSSQLSSHSLNKASGLGWIIETSSTRKVYLPRVREDSFCVIVTSPQQEIHAIRRHRTMRLFTYPTSSHVPPGTP